MPVGGHIELDEDPDQALFREIHEETGLTLNQFTILQPKLSPPPPSNRTKYLLTPQFVDIHQINNTHKHTGLIFFGQAHTDQIIISSEHHDFRWFSAKDLTLVKLPEIRWYATQAIEAVNFL